MFELLGTGSKLPACSKTNDDLSTFLDTSDEWISKRTGIHQRSVCVEETLTDLATGAALAALEQSGIAPEDLDLILCATVRGDYITPSLACMVQKELGANCPSLDINAACSGFIYCLDIAAGYFARKAVKHVLIIAGEAMSRLVDWNDRSTAVLFGDGAGAVVLGEGDNLLSIHISAKGSEQPLSIPHVHGNSPFYIGDNVPTFLSMDGQEVYKFAVSSLCHDVLLVLDKAGITQDDVTYVVPHQANLRIIESAAHRLKIPRERYLTGIENMGNISAAGIPIVLDRANREGCFHKGDILALTAFGGGLTTGACILRY